MTLAEARATIECAWNLPAARVDWSRVAQAAEVVARETGAVYLPGVPKPAPPPDERGTAAGYDTAAHRSDDPYHPYHAIGGAPVAARAARTRYRAPVEDDDELPDAPPAGWART